ncbi:MAG: cobyrinic acid a,c-diamide synthase, partial [Desulfomonilaceae bacterium]
PGTCPGCDYAFEVLRGTGMGNQRDGLVYRNALGTYTHVHAAVEQDWASGIVSAARRFAATHSEDEPRLRLGGQG